MDTRYIELARAVTTALDELYVPLFDHEAAWVMLQESLLMSVPGYPQWNPLALLNDEQLPTATEDSQLEALLWSRRLLNQVPLADLSDRGLFLAVSGQEFVPNVGLTFVGHSHVERPILYRSHLFIDTGAGTTPDGKLTVLRVRDIV